MLCGLAELQRQSRDHEHAVAAAAAAAGNFWTRKNSVLPAARKRTARRRERMGFETWDNACLKCFYGPVGAG